MLNVHFIGMKKPRGCAMLSIDRIFSKAYSGLYSHTQRRLYFFCLVGCFFSRGWEGVPDLSLKSCRSWMHSLTRREERKVAW